MNTQKMIKAILITKNSGNASPQSGGKRIQFRIKIRTVALNISVPTKKALIANIRYATILPICSILLSFACIEQAFFLFLRRQTVVTGFFSIYPECGLFRRTVLFYGRCNHNLFSRLVVPPP